MSIQHLANILHYGKLDAASRYQLAAAPNGLLSVLCTHKMVELPTALHALALFKGAACSAVDNSFLQINDEINTYFAKSASSVKKVS